MWTFKLKHSRPQAVSDWFLPASSDWLFVWTKVALILKWKLFWRCRVKLQHQMCHCGLLLKHIDHLEILWWTLTRHTHTHTWLTWDTQPVQGAGPGPAWRLSLLDQWGVNRPSVQAHDFICEAIKQIKAGNTWADRWGLCFHSAADSQTFILSLLWSLDASIVPVKLHHFTSWSTLKLKSSWLRWISVTFSLSDLVLFSCSSCGWQTEAPGVQAGSSGERSSICLHTPSLISGKPENSGVTLRTGTQSTNQKLHWLF